MKFTIFHPGELAAGIIGFTDTVTVSVESGDPGGYPGEFESFIQDCLREWYDGAKVEKG